MTDTKDAQEWLNQRTNLRSREMININMEIKNENAKNKYKLEGSLNINDLVKLRFFDCSDNEIVKMELSNCNNLQKLILTNNPISGSLEFLKNSSRLSELDISNTDIDDGLELLPESLKKIICKDDNKTKDRKILEQLKDYCLNITKGIYDLEKWREDNRKSIEDAKKKMNEKQKLIDLKNNNIDLLLQTYQEFDNIEKILQDYFQEELNATQLVEKAIEGLKDLESSKAQLEQVSRSQDELKDSKEKEIENLQASLASIKKEHDNIEKNLQDYFQEELNVTQLVEKAIEGLKDLESYKAQLEQVSKSQDELKDSKEKEIENLEVSLASIKKERNNIENLLQDYFQEKLNATQLVEKAIEKLKELESFKVQLEQVSKSQDELKDSKKKEIENLEDSLASIKEERDRIEKILQDYFQEKLNAAQLVEKAIEKLKELESLKVQLEQVSNLQDELKDSKKKEIENLEDSLVRTKKERDELKKKIVFFDPIHQDFYNIEKLLQDYFQEKLNATKLAGKAIEKLKELESSKVQLERNSKLQDELKDSKEKEIKNLEVSLASVKKERDNIEKILQDYFQEKLNATQLVEKAIEKLELFKVQLEQVSKSQDELKDSKENLEDSLARTEKERDKLKEKIVAFFYPILKELDKNEKILQDYFQEELSATQLVGKAIKRLKELETRSIMDFQLLEFQLEQISKLQNELEEKKKEVEELESSLERNEKERIKLNEEIVVLTEEVIREKEEILKKVKIIIETKLELKKEEITKLEKQIEEEVNVVVCNLPDENDKKIFQEKVKTRSIKKFSFINNINNSKKIKNLNVQEEKEAANRELFNNIEGLLDAQDKLIYSNDLSASIDKDKYKKKLLKAGISEEQLEEICQKRREIAKLKTDINEMNEGRVFSDEQLDGYLGKLNGFMDLAKKKETGSLLKDIENVIEVVANKPINLGSISLYSGDIITLQNKNKKYIYLKVGDKSKLKIQTSGSNISYKSNYFLIEVIENDKIRLRTLNKSLYLVSDNKKGSISLTDHLSSNTSTIFMINSKNNNKIVLQPIYDSKKYLKADNEFITIISGADSSAVFLVNKITDYQGEIDGYQEEIKIDFDLSKISYNNEIVVVAKKNIKNTTKSNQKMSCSFDESIAETKEFSWSPQFFPGGTAKISGGIPYLAKGGLEINYNADLTIVKTKTSSITKTFKEEIHVECSPGEEIEVSLVAEKSKLKAHFTTVITRYFEDSEERKYTYVEKGVFIRTDFFKSSIEYIGRRINTEQPVVEEVQLEQSNKLQNELKEVENLEDSLASIKKERNKLEEGIVVLTEEVKREREENLTNLNVQEEKEAENGELFSNVEGTLNGGRALSDEQLEDSSEFNINGRRILSDKQPTEGGNELNISLYNGKPVVYSNINNTSDASINFPIYEINYKRDLLESYKSLGHFFARKITIGGKLLVKESSLVTTTQKQVDILRFYLFCAYNSAKHSIEIQCSELFPLNLLPKIETLDGEKLDTHEKLINWMSNLYQNESIVAVEKLDTYKKLNNYLYQNKSMVAISYSDIISIHQLKFNTSLIFDEMQPGVINFKEKLSLEDWVGNAAYDNLISWAIDFNLFKGLIVNQNHGMEISKKMTINFIDIPKVNLNDKYYLEMIRPSTKFKATLISHNIFSTSSFPFVESDVKSREGYNHILVKRERFEILLNKDNIKPTKEFEKAIEEALISMKPLKALQHIFNEYGHLFPQRIVLGTSFKNILPELRSSNTFSKVNLELPVHETLKSYLDNLSVSYLLTQKGKNIQMNDFKDANEGLEVIGYDDIIPLYEILEMEQQRRINNILNDCNDFRIIMTGITYLDDDLYLDNNNEYYKRINVESSLEGENYEVFGSVVSKSGLKLDNVYVNFGLYDFNGFYAILKKLEPTNINIEDSYVLWMIIGKPSQLSVFSPKNRDFQVEYYNKSIKLYYNQLNYYIETPFLLSQGCIILAHAYYSLTNYEPKYNIKLVEWSYNLINFQIANMPQPDNSSMSTEEAIDINLHICVLRPGSEMLKIDNIEYGKYPLNLIELIGYVITEENLNENITNEACKSSAQNATQFHEVDVQEVVFGSFSHCIVYNLSKETISSLLENITKKSVQPKHEKVSTDWIDSLVSSIAHELSTTMTFNVPADNFTETGKAIVNIISNVGEGTWSTDITAANAIKDIETNFPLYISDYFDQLSGWSREHVFERAKVRIGSNVSELQNSRNPYPAEDLNGPESAMSGKFVKIYWKLSVDNKYFSFNTSSSNPIFISDCEPSSGEVYRYFAFIDNFKQAVSMNEDGSTTKNLYNFTDSAQLWRVDNYGNFYALYNKKYKKYLGNTLTGTDDKPNNNWHKSAVYIVENVESFTYSIGYTYNNIEIEYPSILKDLTLVTVPLVAWRNPLGEFISLEDADHGTLNFSNGEQYDNIMIPKSEQLFLFVPHPDFSSKAVIVGNNGKFLEFNPLVSDKASCSYDLKTPARLPFILFEYDQNIWPWSANYLASRSQQPLVAATAKSPGGGTRVRIWKTNPSFKNIGTHELCLTNIDLEAGPKDSWFEIVSTTQPTAPDTSGNLLFDFEDTPSQIPESDNHVRFDVVHTFSVVHYIYDLLIGDLEYLDGSPPVLHRPWGENKRLSIYPHAGEMASAFYSRDEAALKFFFTKQTDEPPIYLCRSLDVVAHETGRSFLDILQPQWLTNSGQAGAFHEAFGDLNILFVLISLADFASSFIAITKANLRATEILLADIKRKFGDTDYHKGKGLKNLFSSIKGSEVEPEVHALSMVFSGFYYDVLVDIFELELERNSSIKGDTEILMDVGTNLRRALIIAIRVTSAPPTRTKFQEIAINLDTAIGTLSRRLGVDLTSWRQIVRKHAKARELSVAGFGKNASIANP